MANPMVAVVGRPNVGKSTLFNKIVGQRLSIIEDTPGVTRDRIYCDSEWRGRAFTLVDTGGIEPYTGNEILDQMRRQAQIAIDQADAVIFVTDIKSGVTDADVEEMDRGRLSYLRRSVPFIRDYEVDLTTETVIRSQD